MVQVPGTGKVWGPQATACTMLMAVGSTPVPLKLLEADTESGVSVTFKFPARLPMAVGRKVTLMVQLVFAANVAAQLLDCEKSPALVPEKLIELMVAVWLPVL